MPPIKSATLDKLSDPIDYGALNRDEIVEVLNKVRDHTARQLAACDSTRDRARIQWEAIHAAVSTSVLAIDQAIAICHRRAEREL